MTLTSAASGKCNTFLCTQIGINEGGYVVLTVASEDAPEDNWSGAYRLSLAPGAFADPLVLAGVVLAMLLLGIVATWIPAQRALSVDPLILLREE